MPIEQKGYTITSNMTSDPDPDSDTTIRARLVALLAGGAKPSGRGKYRGRYEVSPEDERAWRRASEQERRRMLKDCGWL